MKSFVWLDDKSKPLTRWNRNYFFVTTVFVVLLNIILYSVFGSKKPRFEVSAIDMGGSFTINNLFQALVNSYCHSTWQHVLLNMLCFFIAGLYLERKKGSLKFSFFIFVLSLFTAFAICTNDRSLGWKGFSGVNFGLYGYIIIEFTFMLFQKEKRYLFNIIVGVIILGLIYFAMCFNGGSREVSFETYPYDLLHNSGHASGFVIGLVFGLYEQFVNLISQNKTN